MRRYSAWALLTALVMASVLINGCSEHGASDAPTLVCDQPDVTEPALAHIRDELRIVLLQLAWIETDQPMPEAIIALNPHHPEQQKQAFSIAREQGASAAVMAQTQEWLDGLSLTDIRSERQDDIVSLVRCRAVLQGLPTGAQPLGYSAYHDPESATVTVELIGL